MCFWVHARALVPPGRAAAPRCSLTLDESVSFSCVFTFRVIFGRLSACAVCLWVPSVPLCGVHSPGLEVAGCVFWWQRSEHLTQGVRAAGVCRGARSVLWGLSTQICGAGFFLWELRKRTVRFAKMVPSLFLLATDSGKKNLHVKN